MKTALDGNDACNVAERGGNPRGDQQANHPSTMMKRSPSPQSAPMKRHRGGEDEQDELATPAADTKADILKKLLVSLGQDGNATKQTQMLASVMQSDAGALSMDPAIEVLIDCARAFSRKTSLYAVLTGLLSKAEPTAGFALRAVTLACDAITDGSTRADRMLLRYLGACCARGNFVGDDVGEELQDCFYSILETLAAANSSSSEEAGREKAGDDDDEDDDDDEEGTLWIIGGRREARALSILSALPWFTTSCESSSSWSSTLPDNEEEETANVPSARKRALIELIERSRRQVLPRHLAAAPRLLEDRSDAAVDRLACGLAVSRETNGEPEYRVLLAASREPLSKKTLIVKEVHQALESLRRRIAQNAYSTRRDKSMFLTTTHLELFPDRRGTEEFARPPTPTDRFLWREWCHDVMESFQPDAPSAAGVLCTIAGSAHVVVECVFSRMLSPVEPASACGYYANVAIELCATGGERYVRALEESLDALLATKPRLDADAEDRLATWLLTHARHFHLTWEWGRWANRADLSMDAPSSVETRGEEEEEEEETGMVGKNGGDADEGEDDRILLQGKSQRSSTTTHHHHRNATRSFVAQVVQRLSIYFPRAELARQLPPNLATFLLPGEESRVGKPRYVEPIGSLAPAVAALGEPGETSEGEATRIRLSNLAQELQSFLRTKPKHDEILRWFREDERFSELSLATRCHLAVECVLNIGTPSFTHLRNALERVAKPLLELASDADDEGEVVALAEAALACAVGFWREHPNWAAFAVLALVDSGLVSHVHAVNWLMNVSSSSTTSSTKGPFAPTAPTAYWSRRAAEDVFAHARAMGWVLTRAELGLSVDDEDDEDSSSAVWLKRRVK